jgi:hypothetical protein
VYVSPILGVLQAEEHNGFRRTSTGGVMLSKIQEWAEEHWLAFTVGLLLFVILALFFFPISSVTGPR